MKSDDVIGRVKTYESVIKGANIPEPGIPESFKVLLKELQALGLDMKVLDEAGEEVEIMETSEYGNTDLNSVISGDSRNYAFESADSFARAGMHKQEFNSDGDLEDVEEDYDGGYDEESVDDSYDDSDSDENY